MRVVARTSSFSFKDVDQDIREIGLILGVQTILEGSVRKAGDKALAVSQQALNLDPDLADAHSSRGWALVQIRQFDAAEKHFNMAIQLDPQLFDAYSP